MSFSHYNTINSQHEMSDIHGKYQRITSTHLHQLTGSPGTGFELFMTTPVYSQHLIVFIAFRSVPKFMKRMKVPDYKEKSVFGVPLIVHVQRCGFPLPLCLQQALSHLRTHCLDQVGIQFLQ